MFTQFLGTAATVYGVLAALKTLLQTRQMIALRTSRPVSARFLASYTGGYAIWLTYGLSTGSLPLIVVDAVGLLCGGLTLVVALSLRGWLIYPSFASGLYRLLPVEHDTQARPVARTGEARAGDPDPGKDENLQPISG